MNRIVVGIMMVLMSMLNVVAQDLNLTTPTSTRIGVKMGFGVNTSRPESSLMLDGLRGQTQLIRFMDASPQYNMGLWLQKKIGYLYFDAQAMFSMSQTKFELTKGVSDLVSKEIFTDRMSNIDLQVMAGLHTSGFRFGVGPYFQTLLSMDSELNRVDNININYRKFSTGFSGGIGYDLGRWGFDLKFDRAFRTVGDHIYFGQRQSKFSTTPDRLTLTLAYSLF